MTGLAPFWQAVEARRAQLAGGFPFEEVPEQAASPHPDPDARFYRKECRQPAGQQADRGRSIEAARDWVKRFATWYNGKHLHSGIRFVAPNTRHAGQDQTVLAQRACLWAAARAARPERWSGQPRNWAPVADVWLNPERATGALKIRDAA